MATSAALEFDPETRDPDSAPVSAENRCRFSTRPLVLGYRESGSYDLAPSSARYLVPLAGKSDDNLGEAVDDCPLRQPAGATKHRNKRGYRHRLALCRRVGGTKVRA